MRLPSSSSLLLASLASSSSLSALAAPTGDCPEDSSSTASALPNRDDSAIRSSSKSTSCTTATFASDTVTDDLQSRGLLNDLLAAVPLPPPTDAIVKGVLEGIFSNDKKYPKARDVPIPIEDVEKTVGGLTGKGGAGRRAAREEGSGETDSPQDPSSPAAANPDGSAKPPAPATPAPPSPPAAPAPGLPVHPPVPLPVSGLPVNPPAGRRDASDVNELLSPTLPPGPPNTPAQRGLPINLPKLPNF